MRDFADSCQRLIHFSKAPDTDEAEATNNVTSLSVVQDYLRECQGMFDIYSYIRPQHG